MAQRIHCIRSAVNKGYGRIHPELGYNPPYAFKPTNKYKARGVMRISEHMLGSGRGSVRYSGRCGRRLKAPKRARFVLRIRT